MTNDQRNRHINKKVYKVKISLHMLVMALLSLLHLLVCRLNEKWYPLLRQETLTNKTKFEGRDRK